MSPNRYGSVTPALVLPALSILAAGIALGEFMAPPGNVPIARLEENIKRYLEKNPGDASAYYALGRIYSIAYARESEVFSDVFPGDGENLPGLDLMESGMQTFLPTPREAWRDATRRLFASGSPALSPEARRDFERWIADLDAEAFETRETAQESIVALGGGALEPLREVLGRAGLSTEQRRRIESAIQALDLPMAGVRHLTQAIEAYRTAIANEPKMSLARLGLAWCLEEVGDTEEALAAYREAFEAGLEAEKDREDWSAPAGGWHGSVALEAGRKILAISQAIGQPLENEQQARIEGSVADLEKRLESAGFWITPIVIPLGASDALEDLIDPSTTVEFDLVGDGVTRQWEWVRPETGLLVWDPDGLGRVRSGRDLFGNVTWYVFWEHGYQPLALLDDDADGWIAGRELIGLAIWRDLDQDGESGPGEVRPLAAHGIVRLARVAESAPEGPRALRGVEFEDGRVRPTYDWMPRRSGSR